MASRLAHTRPEVLNWGSQRGDFGPRGHLVMTCMVVTTAGGRAGGVVPASRTSDAATQSTMARHLTPPPTKNQEAPNVHRTETDKNPAALD